MNCENTLIVIGRGRERLRHVQLGRLVSIADHHAKLVINTLTDTPPLDDVRALIAAYPTLRFVFYYEDKAGDFRGEIEGRSGKVVKEIYRENIKEKENAGKET